MMLRVRIPASAGLGRRNKLYNDLSFSLATIQFPNPLFSFVLAHLQIFVNSFSCRSACLSCALVCWFIINSSWWLPLPRTLSASLPLAVQTLILPTSFDLLKMLLGDVLILPFPSQPGFPGHHTGKLSHQDERIFYCPLAAHCHNLLTC